MKLVVINDMHPLQNPGAASIAYSLAANAQTEWDVEYWCGWQFSKDPIENSLVNTKSFKVDVTRERRRLESLPRRLWGEFFPGKVFWWFVFHVIKTRPDVLWVHQIGTRFPRSIFVFTKLFGIKTVWTIHDYGLILPRKLYPRDLGILDSAVDTFIDQLQSFSHDKHKLKFSGIDYSLILKMRLVVVRALARLCSQMIFISSMQQQIYSCFGIHSKVVISNGIEPCACKVSSKARFRNSILFAGRATGKGFEQLLNALVENPEMHLHLAGGPELKLQAKRRLESSRFSYHGMLNSSEIHSLLHSVEMVSVASECFDVYPTITLEALRYGSFPITTKVTGNFPLVNSISPRLILEYGKSIDLNAISSSIDFSSTWGKEVRDNLPTVKQVLAEYQSYLIN